MKHLFSLILLTLCGIVSAAAQSIPTYTTIVSDPADGATVSAVTSISISLSRLGYDAPLGIMPGSQPVSAVEIIDGKEEPISELTTAVKGEKLVISFAQPINTAGKVIVTIPEGVTNNLAMPVGTMTTEEIIEEGGCTNPAITLTFNVVPSVLPVVDVTGPGYNTRYATDADGNFVKDEKGQYIRIDDYNSLIDAQLTPSTDAHPEGDRVTVLYFWYDREFANINYTGGARVTNVTTGTAVNVAAVSFKTGGDSHRNDVIELRISTADYIYSEQYHQGVYEVVLPEGIATTADGLKNGGKTFRFTFGDPEKAYKPEELNLDGYLGDYKAIHEDGEEESNEAFSFEKDEATGTYYVTNLCGSSLRIPVEGSGENFVLKYTESDEGDAFMNLKGGDVTVAFYEYEGNLYIYIDQYALYFADADSFIGGMLNFKQEKLVIDGVADPLASSRFPSPSYDLQGRRANANARGILVSGGKARIK